MSSYPLAANTIRQAQSPIEQYGQVANLAALRQRQALMPGQLQEQQQRVQANDLDIQQKQLDLKDRQGMNQALMDTYAPAAKESSGATTPSSDRFSDFLNKIQDPKYGISATGQVGMMEKFNGLREQIGKADKASIDAISAAHKQMSQGLNAVLEAPPEDQPAKWALERNALMRDQTLSKFTSVIPAQYPGTPAPGGSPEAQQMLHGLMAEQDLVASVREKAELPGQIAESTKKQQEVIPPGGGLSPASQQKVQQDIAVATNPQIQAGKVQVSAAEGAAHAQVQEQMARGSNAAVANVPAHLVAPATAEATKLGTEYATLNSQIGNLKNLLSAAKTGDEVANAFIPVSISLGSNAFYGSHRIPPSELTAMGPQLGSVAREIDTWFSKHLSGTVSADSLKEFNSLVDRLDGAANAKYTNGLAITNQNYGSNFKPLKPTPVESGGGGIPQPAGATHTGVGKVDKKKHWLDANQKDLGLAE